ncbi:MAG: class I mannose-6-phosphate isomerase [Candidatus Latescibacteria bacterium]|jgi:mannose-6-phosphate isomerase|nr:class I mannose-6-phosphate isomerase [Candidatus Latescibacterota bacterium]
MDLEVLTFGNIFKSYFWGGRNLGRVLGKRLPPTALVAESWEISDRDEAMSVVADGAWEGRTLSDVIAYDPPALLGSIGGKAGTKFPLLVKFLDAQKSLSVQVHPDDIAASTHSPGESGKTEMWYVVQAERDAHAIAGLSPHVGSKSLRRAVDTGNIEPLLRRWQLSTGDTVLIPAGRVHALGAGAVVLEIQQNSDVTYRLHDWNRVGPDGAPRELHIDRAMDVIDFDAQHPAVVKPVTINESWGCRRILAITPFFIVESWSVRRLAQDYPAGGCFRIVVVIDGTAELSWDSGSGVKRLKRGDVALVPAACQSYSIRPDGIAHLVVSWVPDLPGDITERLDGHDINTQSLLTLCDRPARRELISHLI